MVRPLRGLTGQRTNFTSLEGALPRPLAAEAISALFEAPSALLETPFGGLWQRPNHPTGQGAFIHQPLHGIGRESDGVSRRQPASPTVPHSGRDRRPVRLFRSLCRYSRRGVGLQHPVRTCLTPPRHCATYPLYFPLRRTLGKHGQSPANEVQPLTGMKQPSDGTLDAPSRQHGALRTTTATTTRLTRATGQGHAPARSKGFARTTTTPDAMPYSNWLQVRPAVLPRFGKRRSIP